MKLRLIILVVLMFVVVVATHASQKQPISWEERDNQILHDSVCYNHDYGSIRYRQCKVQAKRHFKEQCRFYERKYRKTERKYADGYKKKKDKFCRSARLYSPV
jgi:hypothetical protein